MLYQKTSNTLSKWGASFKAWGKKQSADLASGKMVMRMSQKTKELLGSTQKTVDNELIAKIESVKTLEHDLKVLIQLMIEVCLCVPSAPRVCPFSASCVCVRACVCACVRVACVPPYTSVCNCWH